MNVGHVAIEGSVIGWLTRVVGVAASVLAVGLLGTSQVEGAREWTNPDGGVFHDADNWDPEGVPGSDEAAVFNLDSEDGYEVLLEENANVLRHVVRNDTVQMILGGNELSTGDGVDSVTVGEFSGDVGVLSVREGTLSTAGFRIGADEGASGILTLGEGVVWTATGVGGVGHSGEGRLNVEDGAQLALGSSLTIGGTAQGAGEVFLSGTGSEIKVAGHLNAGDASRGDIIIQDGASMTIEDRLHLAFGGDHTSTLIVDNATVVADDWVRMARGAATAHSEAIVRNGAVLTMTHEARDFRLSEGAGANGSLWVSGGSRVDVGRHFMVNYSPDGESHLIVEGDGTEMNIRQDLYGAWNPNSVGSTTVADGAVVRLGRHARLGNGAGAHMEMLVSNATLEVSEQVRVGKGLDANAVLTLDGATVTSGRIDRVGRRSNGEIYLRGGTTWVSDAPESDTLIGGQVGETWEWIEEARGLISIEEGSVLTVNGEGAGFELALTEASSGTVSVSGNGSRLEGGDLSLFVGGSRLVVGDEGELMGEPGGEGLLVVSLGGDVDIGGEVFVWDGGAVKVDRGTLRAGRLGFSDDGGRLETVLGVVGDAPIQVSGDIALGSAAVLEVDLAPGFAIQEGESVSLATYGGTRTGEFADLEEGAVVVAGGVEFQISYEDGVISLTAMEDVSIPLPGFEDWILQFELPEGETGPEANPSGDGMANVVKYALGLDPRQSNAAAVPAPGLVDSDGERYLALEIAKNEEAYDVQYIIEVSGDLESWESGAEHVTIIEDSGSVLWVRDNTALSGNGNRFIRLRVILEQ